MLLPLSLSTAWEGEKVELVRRWVGCWGFPHLHVVGDKNLETLGNFLVLHP
jgi:hypothetical protein